MFTHQGTAALVSENQRRLQRLPNQLGIGNADWRGEGVAHRNRQIALPALVANAADGAAFSGV